MDNILVSAIITTYKRMYKDILRSINSVLRQSYNNLEIIIVDDNNEDSEYRIDIKKNIEILKNKVNITYIEHKTNLGAQQSRNDGINAAKGELLAFLDDDDEWLENKIEKQVEVYEDGVGLIYSKGFIVYEDTKEIKEYSTTPYFKESFTFKELLYSDRIGTTTQAMIPKKVIVKEGLFDLNQVARQDYELWLRISKNYKCVGVNEFLFKHYIHSGEQISKDLNKAISGYNAIYKKYYEDYKLYPAAREHYYYRIMKLYFKNKQILKGLLSLLKLIIYMPVFIIGLIKR